MSMNTSSGKVGFLDRLKTGWTLTKDSFAVLRDHPKLMVFPFLAGIASAFFFVLFFFPLLITGFIGTGLEAILLFMLYFITTFFST